MTNSNKKYFKFYFISAFLWLGVVFSVYFIFDVNKEKIKNTEQNIIKSAEKLEKFHQNLFAINEKWWERRESSNISEMYSHKNERDMEVFSFLKKSNDIINSYNSTERVVFENLESHLYKTNNEHLKSIFTENEIKELISNEDFYIKNHLTKILYKNKLLQTFREDRNTPKQGLAQNAGFDSFFPFELVELEENKIGIRVRNISNVFTDVTYKNYPFSTSIMYKKKFEFETSIKTLGRNPKTTTKRYKTTPKEGQKLESFDYEEIE